MNIVLVYSRASGSIVDVCVSCATYLVLLMLFFLTDLMYRLLLTSPAVKTHTDTHKTEVKRDSITVNTE